ncbi:MAG: hypothetical protein IPN34_00770 [Planctomycetes bacterium]|nr:hypothetical protein [Planctomycetota bacterium]
MRSVGRSSRWTALLACALLFLAPAYFLHEALLDPERVLIAADTMAVHAPWASDWGRAANPELSDHAHSWIPWTSFAADEVVHRGRPPLWNPYQFCGSPALGNPQFGHFDPFGVPLHAAFAALSSSLNAFEWGAYLRLVLAGVGSYLLARGLGRSRGAALVAAAIYAYGGFQVLWLLYPLAHVACWLPWVLWAVDRAQREGSRLALLATALFLALAVLSGHPETGFFVGVAAGVFALAGGLARWREGAGARPLATALAALAAGSLLGAPALVPFVEYLGESSIDAVREARAASQGEVGFFLGALRLAAAAVLIASAALATRAERLGTRALVGAACGGALALLFCASEASLYPQLLVDSAWLGDPRTGGWRGPATFLEAHTAYVGALALALAAIGWTAAPRGGVRWRAPLATLALLVLLAGRGIEPFETLLHAVPPFSMVELTRAHLIANLALALLAALGLDGALDSARLASRERVRAWIAPLATLLVLALGSAFASPDQVRAASLDLAPLEVAAAGDALLEPRGLARSGESGVPIRVRLERDGTRAVARLVPRGSDAAVIERELVPSLGEARIAEARFVHLELPNGAYDVEVRLRDERGERTLRGGRILWGLQGGALSSRGRTALLGAAGVVLALLFAALLGASARPLARTALAGAVLLAVGFELWTFGGTWNTVCAKAPIFRATPSLEFLYARLAEARARGDGEFRIWGATEVLPPNAASGVRLRDVRGYDAIECARWQLLQQSLLLLPALRSPLVEWPSSPAQLHVGNFPVEGAVMRGMGVRYALDRRSFAPELLQARGLRLAFPAASALPPRDGVYVYEPIGAEGRRAFLTTRAIGATEGAARLQGGDRALAEQLDRTLLLSDEAAASSLAPPMTRGELRFEVDEPDRVVLRLEGLDGEAWLALMDSAFPGWEATIDGEPAPIEVAQLAFRALRLPAGAQRVEFVYRPRSLRVGLGLAALGAVVALVALWGLRLRSSRTSAPLPAPLPRTAVP